MLFDWESGNNEVLINPRFPEKEKNVLQEALKQAPHLKGHVWLLSSGTSGQHKWVALSKQALLVSAKSVNQHLKSHSTDIWLHGLPHFHVGGVGIYARAYLSHSKIVLFEEKWCPFKFHEALTTSQATLTSLVPAQVYDLVLHDLKAPPSIRAIVVGGGALSENLYQKVKLLGWPILPTYGLTECSSQVATAYSDHPDLHPLSHIEIKIDEHGFIQLKSEALLTLYGCIKEGKGFFMDPKEKGWFTTEDKGEIKEGLLKVFGRSSAFIKIGGESVDLRRLESILEEICLEKRFTYDCALVSIPDERLGNVVHVCVEKGAKAEFAPILEAYQARVLPFEKIRKIHVLEKIPRTSLSKIAKMEVLKLL